MDRGKLNPRVFSFTPAAAAIDQAVVDGNGGAVGINIVAGAGNDVHNGKRLTVISGPGAGESKMVLDYVSVSGLATVDSPWVTHPDGTSRIVLAHTLEAVSRQFVVTSATDTTLTLEPNQGVVQVDDWYNNLMVKVISGTGRGTRRIFDTTGATRVLSIGQKWRVNPVAGDIVEVEGHLYFPNKGLHIRVAAAASMALQPGALNAAVRISVGAAGVLWPPAEDPAETENIPYVELNGATNHLIQRWE